MAVVDLHHDILWRIFLMNADLDAIMDLGSLYEPNKAQPRYRYSPLTLTRCTSQVCQLWRNLILGSPSIWGRVIHLDFLDQATDDWRSELLRRTGEAPLCIKGEINGYVMEDFFLSLLETEWSRIRRLDVQIHNEWEFEDDTWEPLLRPTTTLELFNLNYSYSNSRILSGSKPKLFSNNAPSLREFYSSGVPYSLQASWISQLRHISISSPFKVPQVLDTFKNMMLLESVQLDQGILGHHIVVDPLPIAFLPRLQSITLSGHLETSLQFLECITPALGCGLCLNTTNKVNRNEITSGTLETAHRVLSRYSQNYFDVYNPKRLVLRLVPSEFHVYDLLDPIRVPSSPTFKITIHGTPALPPSGIPTLLKSVSTLSMSTLTHLEFHFSAAIESHNPAFMSFMRSLSSLETLQISSLETLEFLRTTPWSRSTPLPALRSLKIAPSMTLSIQKLSRKFIERFLKWRVQLGVPIVLIDLTFCDTRLFGDLTFLENFQNVKVKWSNQHTVTEYLCGRKIPGRLQF